MIRQAYDFLARLGGGDNTVLEQAPQERARFVQMAGILLTTAIIAVVSMIFALRYALRVSLIPSILFSLLWGVLILNLDRFLVLSIGATRDRSRLVTVALPRLMLAALISIVVSTPLVLRIFATDINAQLIVMQARQSVQQKELIANGSVAEQANRVQQQINIDEEILSSRNGGTSTLRNVARKELPALLAQYKELETQQQTQAVSSERAIRENNGLLAQLQALSEASAQNPSLEGARVIVLALFFLIEILPVTVKILANLGPLSAYEVVAKYMDDELTDSMRARRIEGRRIEESKSQIRLNVADDMRIREEDLGKRTNERVAGEMAKVLDAALRKWSDQLHAGLTTDEGGGSEKRPVEESLSASVHVDPGYELPDGGNL